MAKKYFKQYRAKTKAYAVEVQKVTGDFEVIDTENGKASIAPGNFIATVIKDKGSENAMRVGSKFGLTEADLEVHYDAI